VVDIQGGINLGTQKVEDIVIADDAPTLAATKKVQTGSTVNGIYFKIESYATTSGALANFYIAIVKNPGGNVTFPNANAIGADDNKRFVIHQEMVMFQKVTPSNPRTVLNGVVVIPKGYRRMAPNDTIQVLVFSPGVNCDFCIEAHYKEFR